MSKTKETIIVRENKHKPVIETIINTAAIAISALGVTNVTKGDYMGLVLIVFAAALEYFKYLGRKQDLW